MGKKGRGKEARRGKKGRGREEGRRKKGREEGRKGSEWEGKVLGES